MRNLDFDVPWDIVFGVWFGLHLHIVQLS